MWIEIVYCLSLHIYNKIIYLRNSYLNLKKSLELYFYQLRKAVFSILIIMFYCIT